MQNIGIFVLGKLSVRHCYIRCYRVAMFYTWVRLKRNSICIRPSFFARYSSPLSRTLLICYRRSWRFN